MRLLILITIFTFFGCKDDEAGDQLPDISISPTISNNNEGAILSAKAQWENKSKTEYTLVIKSSLKDKGKKDFRPGVTVELKLFPEDKGSGGADQKIKNNVEEFIILLILKKGNQEVYKKEYQVKGKG